MTTPTTTRFWFNGPRHYQVGDTIPDHGIVVAIWTTAYKVQPAAPPGVTIVVPFYGPNGVDEQRPGAGLVTFADGTRYGG
jgi:hypothetical protein